MKEWKTINTHKMSVVEGIIKRTANKTTREDRGEVPKTTKEFLKMKGTVSIGNPHLEDQVLDAISKKIDSEKDSKSLDESEEIENPEAKEKEESTEKMTSLKSKMRKVYDGDLYNLGDTGPVMTAGQGRNDNGGDIKDEFKNRLKVRKSLNTGESTATEDQYSIEDIRDIISNMLSDE